MKKHGGLFGFIKRQFESPEEAMGFRFRLRNSGTYDVSGDKERLPSEVVIPSVYKGMYVSYINREGFADCTQITKVTIPESVLGIFDKAFFGCTSLTEITLHHRIRSVYGNIVPYCPNLTSITVSPENERYFSAGNCLINRETGELQAGCGTSVIPNDGSVRSIGRDAFLGAARLTHVEIPESVTKVGFDAFEDCTGLPFTVYENGRYLGNPKNPHYALIGAVSKDITSCKIHPDTRVIADFAFSHINGLTEIEIPDSVVTVGDYAFSGCSSLTRVTVGNGALNIGGKSFDCDQISFTVYENGRYLGNPSNPHYALIGAVSEDITSCTIHPDTRVIADEAFRNCVGLARIAFPAGLTSIGDSVFEGCSRLASVVILDGVTRIGYAAFRDCTALTSMIIPSGVTSIETSTFNGCTSLRSVTIPDSVTCIESSAFWGCSSLTSVTVGNGVARIEESAFSGCKSLTSLALPEALSYVGDCLFMCCSSLEDVSFRGTRAAWSSVRLHPRWKGDTSPFKVVHCTDGDVEVWA
ncbi:MAG: leucine-rich repeat domain-containing protein [Clostridia bacterium]|nr:leucine-rich repeat domain-containing protein [Clostridia bacterium]